MDHDSMAELNALTRQIRLREAERKAGRKRRRFDPASGKLVAKISRNRLIHDVAIVCEPIGRGIAQLWITNNACREEYRRMREECSAPALASELCDPDALNGYIAFPKRHAPRLPMTTGGLAQYIPVHGGITYALKDSFAAVWGFDTMHAGSEKVARTDLDWIRYQCHILHHGLEVAGGLWPEFRRQRDTLKRAGIAQSLLDIDAAASGALNERLGFEALVNLLFGRIG